MHVTATKHVFDVAQLVGGSDDWNHRYRHRLCCLGDLSERFRHRYPLFRRGQRMRIAQIIGVAIVLVDLAMPRIAEAAAVTEDVK